MVRLLHLRVDDVGIVDDEVPALFGRLARIFATSPRRNGVHRSCEVRPPSGTELTRLAYGLCPLVAADMNATERHDVGV